MNPFKKWFADREQAKRDRRFQRGYDWAAGALLRGTPTCEIAMQIDNPFDSDEFEKGGRRALLDFAKITARKAKP